MAAIAVSDNCQCGNEIDDVGLERPAGLSDSVLFDRQLGSPPCQWMTSANVSSTTSTMISLTSNLMIFLRVSMDTPGLFHALANLLRVHQSCALLGRKRWDLQRLLEALELNLQVAQLNQLLVPAPLQLTGDQPVIGIDGIVLATCFVLGVLRPGFETPG